LAKLEGKTFSYDFGSHDAYYMLGADVIFYMLAYLYFDQVVENEYGTQKHPLFLFGKFSRQKSNNRPHGEVDLANLKEPLANSFQDAGDYSSAIYHEPFENH
jgi:ATP-binding cassette subfamily A (ABC1) protein 3